MAPNGFIGSRGGVELSHEGDKTRRKVPLAIACTMAAVCNVITLCIYATAWAYLAQGWWNSYQPNMWVGPFRAWFRRVDAVLAGTMGWAGPQFFKALIPLFIEWAVCLGVLVLFDELPRIITAEGIVPMSQYNPNDGLRTTWGMIFHRYREPIEQEQSVEGPRFVRVSTPATRRARRRTEQKANTTPAWVKESYRVIMALWGEPTLSRNAFKDKLGRGGTRLYYKYVKGTRNEHAWFQQWGVIEQADNRGSWRWSKPLNEVLAVDPELTRYAQAQSPTPPMLVSE